MTPNGQNQFQWPTQMMPPPGYGPGPQPGYGPGPQYYPGPGYDYGYDQRMAAMQAPSPRMQPNSPRFSEQGYSANPVAPPVAAGAAAESDPKKVGLLGPCKFSCKKRFKKPACKVSCGCCTRSRSRIPSAKTASRGFKRALGSVFSPCINAPVIRSGRWRLWFLLTIALAAIGSLLAALLDEEPHLLAAGLSAALGWLATYAYMLQLDCWRLVRGAESDLSRQIEGKDDEALPVESVAPPAGVDLDVTMLAKSLGSPFVNPLATVAPGQGKAGQTMQAVLTSALVNEYLRCADLLKKYQKKHGHLPNAPEYNPSFADALLTGLHGTPANRPPTSTGSPSAGSADNGGTPNFADRLASVNQAPSGTAGAGSSSSSSHAAASVPPLGAGTGLAELLAQGSSSPRSTSTPAQPPLGELDRCITIDKESGVPFSLAASRSSPEPTPERGPAGRSSARLEDLDSSANDPPWLRAIRAHD